MPQNDRLPACPACAEPPEAGDLFCEACGTDLRPALSAHPPLPPPPPPAPVTPTEDGVTGPGRSPVPGTAPGGEPGLAGGPGSAAAPPPPPGPPVTAAVDGPVDAPHTDPALVGPETGTPRPGARPVSEDAGSGPAPDTGASPTGGREGPWGDRPADGGAPVSDPGTGGDPGTSTAPGRAPDVPPAGKHCVACGTGVVGADGHCTRCGHQQPLARDHWERALSGAAGASDRGLRHRRNEDFFVVASAETPDGEPAGIAVVCDGVSSAQRSDQASEAAAEAAGASMRESIPRGVHAQQAMHDALVTAAGAVDALATEEEREAQRNAPACTIVGAVVAAGILTVGWIGDSRAYWVPDDRHAQPARLTEDDSWAAQMVATELMSEEQAYADARAHAITGWLGADAYEIDPHTASFKPDRPGVVIVCTDGLWNYAETAEQMAAAVPSDAADRPLAAARHLVGFALDGGGHDNVTVAVIPFPTRTEAETTA